MDASATARGSVVSSAAPEHANCMRYLVASIEATQTRLSGGVLGGTGELGGILGAVVILGSVLDGPGALGDVLGAVVVVVVMSSAFALLLTLTLLMMILMRIKIAERRGGRT